MTEQKKKAKAIYWVCVEAATIFYTKGRVYKLVDCPKGTGKGFTCDKGYFDLKSMVVSKFVESTKEAYDRQESIGRDKVVTISDLTKT